MNFKSVQSGRTKRDKMIVATAHIPRGEFILKRNWMERTTFIITNDKEAAEFATGSTPPPTSFTPEESMAIGGGSAISRVFTQFKTPAHLQMTCSLIQRHSPMMQQWLKDGSFFYRSSPPPGIADMTPERHRVCMNWLKGVNVPVQMLLHWAVRENFTALYHMVCYNAFSLEFLLSGTVAGLVFCPILSAFNHDCIPNVHVEYLTDGYRMSAAVDIEEGTELRMAYMNSAIGLVTPESIDELLMARFGFKCQCDYHQGKRRIFRAGDEPHALATVLYRNKSLAVQYVRLCQLVEASEWAQVRSLGKDLWDTYGSIIQSEPRLAFAIGSQFVRSLPYTPPTENGTQWTTLLENTLAKYCANPLYTVRAYFYTLIETIHRGDVMRCSEEVLWLRPQTDNDLVIFLNRWMEIRKYLLAIFGSPVDILNMESRLFRGLFQYFQIMEQTILDLEGAHLTPVCGDISGGGGGNDTATTSRTRPGAPRAVNVTTVPIAIELGVVYPYPVTTVTGVTTAIASVANVTTTTTTTGVAVATTVRPDCSHAHKSY